MLRHCNAQCITAKKGISFKFNIAYSCYVQFLSSVITTATEQFLIQFFSGKNKS